MLCEKLKSSTERSNQSACAVHTIEMSTAATDKSL